MTSEGKYWDQEPFKKGGANNCPDCYELMSGDISCNDSRCCNSDAYHRQSNVKQGELFKKLMSEMNEIQNP